MGRSSALLEKKSFARQSEESGISASQSGLNQVQIDNVLENELAGPGMDVDLTEREKEIFKLILAGNTNKEIAQKLYRTERTVEYHRNRLMHKLGTRNIVELVKCAIAIGIA